MKSLVSDMKSIIIITSLQFQFREAHLRFLRFLYRFAEGFFKNFLSSVDFLTSSQRLLKERFYFFRLLYKFLTSFLQALQFLRNRTERSMTSVNLQCD